jgi:hypothetical protein
MTTPQLPNKASRQVTELALQTALQSTSVAPAVSAINTVTVGPAVAVTLAAVITPRVGGRIKVTATLDAAGDASNLPVTGSLTRTVTPTTPPFIPVVTSIPASGAPWAPSYSTGGDAGHDVQGAVCVIDDAQQIGNPATYTASLTIGVGHTLTSTAGKLTLVLEELPVAH